MNQPNLENAACEREMIFLALSRSSELKFQLACRMQISKCYCDCTANDFLAKYRI